MTSEDVKTKKRKGAADAAPKPKKQKKSDAATAAAKHSAKALKSAVEPLDAVPTKVPAKANRARAQDFFDSEDAPKDETAKEKKHKKKNQATQQPGGDKEETEVANLTVVEVQEKPKKGKKVTTAIVEVDAVVETLSEAPKKAKKGKKGNASSDVENISSETAVEAESAAVAVKAPAEVAKPKPKKAKKGKAQVEMEAAPEKESNAAPSEEPPVAEAPVEAPKPKTKRGRKGKGGEKTEQDIAEEDAAPAEADALAAFSVASKKSRKEKPSKTAKSADLEPEIEAGEDAEGDDEQVDDQTAALLAGFDSDNDEADAEDKDFDSSAKPMIPGELRDDLNKVAKQKGAKRGVVFIGRLPHGFFEPQLKAYFAQFGTVTRLRLSRNKKTGASKHYAFIEFASEGVAEIVAKTMDKYLLFGHILQCRTLSKEQVHPDLFKDANSRFKVMPRNHIAGAEMERGAERAVWEKRVEKETTKRAKLNKKLKEKMGYEFTAPQLKAVEDIPIKDADGPEQQLLTEEADGQDRPDTIVEVTHTEEATPNQLIVTESVKTKKPKKAPKTKQVSVPEPTEPEAVSTASLEEKKAKKAKKAKAAPVIEPTKDKMEGVESGDIKKGKKGKKATPVEAPVEGAVKDKKRKAKPVEPEATDDSKPKKAKKAKAKAA